MVSDVQSLRNSEAVSGIFDFAKNAASLLFSQVWGVALYKRCGVSPGGGGASHEGFQVVFDFVFKQTYSCVEVGDQGC